VSTRSYRHLLENHPFGVMNKRRDNKRRDNKRREEISYEIAIVRKKENLFQLGLGITV
jgi:hypothetical protein